MQQVNHQINPTIEKIVAILIICITGVITHIVVDDRFLRDACALGGMLIVFNGFIYVSGKRDLLVFLYPSAIAINYLYFSMFVGAIGFYKGSIAIAYMQNDPFMWSSSPISNAFLSLVVGFSILFIKYGREKAVMTVQNSSVAQTVAVFCIFLFALLSFKYINFLLGEQLVGSIFCVYILSVISFRRFSTRLFLYALALIPFMLAMSHSKREALFFLYPILVIETIIGKWGRLNLRGIVVVTMMLCIMVLSIIAMNVVRAPDVFRVDSLGDYFTAIIDYLQWPDLTTYLLLNIEATYAYYHVYNSIDLAMKDIIQPLMGETYIKPFFIWIPRDWVDWKPRSAVDIYTTIFAPAYRAEGGSWAISMMGEAFLNFRIFGALLLVAILSRFDWIFRSFVLKNCGRGLLYGVGTIYFTVSLMNFARGTGLDLILIQFIVVMTAALPLAMMMNYRASLSTLYVREPLPQSGGIFFRVSSLPKRYESKLDREAEPLPK